MTMRLRKSELPDCYVIECDPGELSDASVEGSAVEMLAIADAIEKRTVAIFRRCAVSARDHVTSVEFWSPRNSRASGWVPYEDALPLVALIREKCGNAT